MKDKLSNSVHHYLDGARGQYIPRDFARGTKRDCIEGVDQKDLDYLALGPGGCLDECTALQEGETVRGEFYWDTWQTVCDDAIVIDPDSGLRFKLYQDDSLFLVPEDWEWNDEIEGFEPPESDTLRRYELPAYWASYLINGDDSGIEESESKACDSFITREGLEKWTCADCSRESYFSHGNDGTNLGCDTLRYTFVLIGQPVKVQS